MPNNYIFFDSFTDDDNTALDFHEPEIGTWEGGSNTYAIRSNRLGAHDFLIPIDVYFPKNINNNIPYTIQITLHFDDFFGTESQVTRIYYDYSNTGSYVERRYTHDANAGFYLFVNNVQVDFYSRNVTGIFSETIIIDVDNNSGIAVSNSTGISVFNYSGTSFLTSSYIGIRFLDNLVDYIMTVDDIQAYYSSTNYNDSATLYMFGKQTKEKLTPLYTAANFHQRPISLYTKNLSTAQSGLTLYTVAEIHSGDSHLLPLYLSAGNFTSLSDNIPLVLPYDVSTLPTGTVNKELGLYLEQHGQPINSDLFPLYINTSKDTRFNSIQLYLEQIIPTGKNAIPLYIPPFAENVDNLPLYVHVEDITLAEKSGTPLYVLGTDGNVSGFKKTSLYTFSEVDPKNRLNLYVDGHKILRSDSNSAQLYSKGAISVEATGGFDMVVYNIQDTDNKNIPLYTFSTVPIVAASSVPMYVDGHGANNSITKLYTNGY